MESVVNINVITLGDAGVGKTSLIKGIFDGNFKESNKTTVTLDNFVIKRKYERKNIIISLNFHDTLGFEKNEGIIPKQYIRDSHVVLLVFDSLDSLDNLKRRWYSFYKENANIDNSKFILVGNKSDLFGNNRDEIVKRGDQFVKK